MALHRQRTPVYFKHTANDNIQTLEASQRLMALCTQPSPNIENMRQYFEAGANPNYKPSYDKFKSHEGSAFFNFLHHNPPLSYAREGIDLFLSYGLDLNLTNGFQNSILTYILLQKPANLDTFFYLHSKGASLYLQNKTGLDTIEEALEHMLFSQVASIAERIEIPQNKMKNYIALLAGFLSPQEQLEALTATLSVSQEVSPYIGLSQLYAKLHTQHIIKEQNYLNKHIEGVSKDNIKNVLRKI